MYNVINIFLYFLAVSQKKYMPGLYPKTKEEKKAAAEKYGLHPDEYKSCNPDTNYAGDYPDLPFISVDAKDPFYPWDIPALRRNFEEPVRYYELIIIAK